MTATNAVALLSALAIAGWLVRAVANSRAARGSDRPASTESDERAAGGHLDAGGGVR